MGWSYLPLSICLLATSAFAETSIYRCTVNGIATFSDSPCGQDATPVTLNSERISTFAPVPAAKVQMPKKPRRAVADAPAIDRKDRCVSIRAALRDIDAKFRSGYTAKQGLRLEERKRNLRKQARELKC
jgi:hypothetical protein